MTTTAQNIIDRVEVTLKDIGGVRWPEAEILRAINDAESALLEARPDLYPTYTNLTLVPGNEQALPADGYKLLDVMFNIEPDGSQGKAITRIRKSVLDRQRRAWTSDKKNTEVRHWGQDEREFKRFVVAPAQPDTTSQKVRIRYAAYPTTIAAAGDELSSPDELINAIYYACMTRALEKDEKFSGSPQAARFANMFAAYIGARGEADAQYAAVRKENEET